jgi:ribonuclease D
LTPFILCVSLIAERARLAEELTPFILCVSLIAERTRLAASVSLPAYMVVSEQSLLQLAEMRPTSPASLARIQVGEQLLWSRFREDRLNPFYFRPRIHKKKNILN